MKNYELLRILVVLLEGGCFILSISCAYYYYKNVIIEKSPTNGSFLIFANLLEIGIICSMIIFAILNFVLIFTTPSIYFFKIIFLILCMIFIILFILKSNKEKNAK